LESSSDLELISDCNRIYAILNLSPGSECERLYGFWEIDLITEEGLGRQANGKVRVLAKKFKKTELKTDVGSDIPYRNVRIILGIIALIVLVLFLLGGFSHVRYSTSHLFIGFFILVVIRFFIPLLTGNLVLMGLLALFSIIIGGLYSYIFLRALISGAFMSGIALICILFVAAIVADILCFIFIRRQAFRSLQNIVPPLLYFLGILFLIPYL
jgi:hypothetical protein